MREPDRTADLELLAVAADASPAAVTRAYHSMKALYSRDSLATYALVTDEDRETMLKRIEEAHRRLVGSAPIEEKEPAPPGSDPVVEGLSVDLAELPGEYFKQARERRGLSLDEVANQTKIGIHHLQNIEAENFEGLPVPVYLKGFLVAYAQTIRLPDPRNAAGLYLAKYRRNRSDPAF